MDNQRLILFLALSFVLFLTWKAWQEDYAPQEMPPPVAVESATPALEVPQDVPGAQQTLSSETPVAAEATATPPATGMEDSNSQRIHVVTDTLDIIIDTRGGDIRQADLLKYPVASNKPDEPFRLMKDTFPNLFVAQSGLLSNNNAPDHHALFTAEKSVAIGRFDFEDAFTQFQNRNVESAATEIKYSDLFVFLLV